MSVNKLVRDKIPEIITESTGKSPQISILNHQDYLDALVEKLGEEYQEFCQDRNPEELADILEVTYALGVALDLPQTVLDQIRAKKVKERGAFTKKIKLLGY